MSPMPLQDALFLMAEAREKPAHVAGLHVYELPDGAGPGFLGEMLEQMLTMTEVNPKLSRRPVRGLGGLGPWEWEVDDNLDLEYHVRHSALPYPGQPRQLLTLVSRLHGTLLDRARPLWESHLIEGLDDNRFAIYTKIHHALVDGVSGMKLMERAHALTPDDLTHAPPWAPQPRPPRAEQPPSGGFPNPINVARDVVGGVLDGAKSVSGAYLATLKTVLRSFQEQAAVLPYQAPRSVLNVPISGARRFAADDWDLGRIHAVRSALGATVNDVVMAMCGGALRTYLTEIGALPDDSLVAMVPVSLRAEGDEDSGNAVGVILCRLATEEADPAKRFAAIRQSMEQGKLGIKGLDPTATMLVSALTFAPLGLGPMFRFEAFRKPPFNLIISNVPGPRNELYLRGARMQGTYPLSIPTDGQAANITVTTYTDRISFGITGDREALPSLQRMLHHLEQALVELEGVAGI